MTEQKKTTEKSLGLDEVEKNLTEEQEEGLRGVKVDPTPNHHYTVPGVLAGKPTPETDEKAAQKAAEVTRV